MNRMEPSLTKRFVSAVLSAAMTTAVFVHMVPVAMAAQATASDKLNIRSGPGTSYQVVKTVEKGTAVETLDSGASGWYQVKLADGTQGYCSSDYLQLSSSDTVTLAGSSGGGSDYGTLTLDTRSYTMAPGGIYDFRAKVEGMGLTQANVTVTSSRTGIATVTRIAGTDKYRITAKGEGVCYVIAEVAGVHASIKVTVQKGVKAGGVAARSISLLGNHPDRNNGSSGGQTTPITLDTKSYTFSSNGQVYQFLAKGIAKGSSPTVTSSNSSAVSVSLKNANDSRGYLYEMKAISAGTAVITVSNGSASAQLTATVSNSGSSGGQTTPITLDTKNYTFSSNGQVYQFLAKGIAKGSSPTVTSSNSSAVSVSLKNANDSRGYLYEMKAISAGTAVITVSNGSASAQLSVTVAGSGSSGGQTTPITLDTKSYTFSSNGQVYQFLAKGIAKGSSPTVTSSNSSAVSVSLKNANDSRGYLYEMKAISAGTAVITVSNGSASAQLTATVSNSGSSGGGTVPSGITGARTTTSVNLRSEPNTDCDKLAVLSSGTIVQVLDTTTHSGWTQVKTTDSKVGYLSNDYIEYLYGDEDTQTSSLKLSHTSGTIPKGKSYYITATVNPTSSAVTWTSSNSSVATVSNGFIYGNQPGTAVITAKSGSKTATCSVTVAAAEPVKAAYTTPNIAGVGQQVQLVAVTDNTRSSVRFVVTMSNGSTKTLNVSNYTAENASGSGLADNNTRVWKTSLTFPSTGTQQVKVYSSTGGSSYSSTGVTTSSFVVSAQDKTTSVRENRRVSDEMLTLIGKWEGYSAAVYPDTLAHNIPTIGYGQTFGAGTLFYNNQTKTEAWAQLLNSVNGSYTTAVNNFLANNNIKANQQNFDSMVSFSYNVGAGYWSGSSAFDIREIMLNSVVPPTISGGSLPATATLNFDLYPSPNANSGKLTEVAASASLQVLQTQVDSSTKSVWYQVQTQDGTTGWARAGYIRFSNNASLQRDLNYTDAYAIGTEWLRWNQAGGSVYAGLVYRRLGEAKVFSFGNYAEASSSSANYRKNTYGYTYPLSAQPYEQ